MIKTRDIEAVVDQIAEAFEPERIILFGSYAYGSPTGDSDVDLMVIRRFRGREHHAATRIRNAIEYAFALDLLVRSPTEIRRRLAWGDFFIRDIVEQGIVLHERDDRRVGEQGRRRLHRRLRAAALAQAQPV